MMPGSVHVVSIKHINDAAIVTEYKIYKSIVAASDSNFGLIMMYWTVLGPIMSTQVHTLLHQLFGRTHAPLHKTVNLPQCYRFTHRICLAFFYHQKLHLNDCFGGFCHIFRH